MAKYVIDIPEETKQAFDNADDINFSYYDYNSVIGKAIRNATPLPKGHSALIYQDDVYDWLAQADAMMVVDALNDGLDIDELPIIIPADTENEVE